MQISKLDRTSYRIVGRAFHEILICLAVALGDGLQALEDLLAESFRAKPIECPAGAILANVVQDPDNRSSFDDRRNITRSG